MKEEKFPNSRKPYHQQVCGEFWNLKRQHNQEGEKKKPTEYTPKCNSQWRSSPDAHVRHQWAGAGQGEVGCMLRVRTRLEFPEDNLRVLMWDNNPNCGIAREIKKKRERERTFLWKPLTWGTDWPAHRTKDWMNTRRKLAGCRPGIPPTRGRKAGMWEPEVESKGQSQLQRQHPPPNVSRLPVANQVFLGPWTVYIC